MKRILSPSSSSESSNAWISYTPTIGSFNGIAPTLGCYRPRAV